MHLQLNLLNRYPYLFSCSEDKTVKCWDLEYNKVTPINPIKQPINDQ